MLTIRKALTRVITQTFEDFQNPTLAVFRQAPFRFTLLAPQSVSTPFDVYINADYTREGAKDLIAFIRDLAIAQTENWSNEQLQEASEARTLYICYQDFNNIFLNFSKEVLTKEEIELQNEGAEVWVSYDISDVGLITLVNELINWL